MRNFKDWTPSKYIPSLKGWIPSHDKNELRYGSRFIANIQIEKYSPIIKSFSRGDLLDVGCGKVPFYGIYRDLVSKTICIDWQKNKYLDLIGDLNTNLPLQEMIFDTVICTDVLEHIYNPINLLTEITRTLKLGGRLLLFVPFFYFIHEIPHDYYRFSEFTLKKFAEENNLKILYLDAYGGLPEIIFDLFAKILNFSGILISIHYYLCLFLVHTRLVKLLSLYSKQRFPIGYCFVGEKSN